MAAETLGIIEARTALPDLVRRITETPTLTFPIGKHRRTDVVLGSPQSVVPWEVRATLLDTFWRSQADSARARLVGGLLNIDAEVGVVLAWLWQTSPDDAARGLVTFHRRLNDAAESPITLDDILIALLTALPRDFERRDHDALGAAAKKRLSEMYPGTA